jgi:hypothetical protein
MLSRGVPFLQTVNKSMAVALNKFCAIGAHVIGLLVWASPASAQAAAPSKAAQIKREGTEAPGTHAPTPVEPYPLNAAGWGGGREWPAFQPLG